MNTKEVECNANNCLNIYIDEQFINNCLSVISQNKTPELNIYVIAGFGIVSIGATGLYLYAKKLIKELN